jgi:ABC-type polysaccharide/polyol phosphate export permease
MAMGGRIAERARWASSTWDLLIALTIRDLRVRYHGTFLSYFWWIARPLALGLVLYFALDKVWQLRIDNPAAFLLSALFPWFWFSNTVLAAPGSFIANAGLVKKVRFPRPILPLSVVLGNTFEFVISLPVLAVLVVASGVDPSWTWAIGVPVLMCLQLALLSGLGMLVATLNVFFRDLAPGLSTLMFLLFYLTPIIYPLDEVPEDIKPLLMLNPLVPLIEGWRELFTEANVPGPELWPAVVLTIVAVVLGVGVLRAIGKSLADAL